MRLKKEKDKVILDTRKTKPRSGHQSREGGNMSETPRTQQLIDIANDEGISDAAVALVLQEHSEQLEREIVEARAEIARKDALIERMKNCQNCGRTGGFCRHCRYAADKRGWDDNWKEPI